MYSRILFAVTLLLCGMHVLSQRTGSSISIQASFPQQQYKASYPVTGVGIRWNVMHRVTAESPMSIGGEVGYMVTGSDSKYFDLYYLGFYDRYRLSASNNILTLGFKARADLFPQEKPLQIFVDGTIGTNLFFSSIDAERETFYGNSQYAGGSSTKGYWAFIAGPGLGMEIPLNKAKEVALSLKASYLFGTNTRYLTDPYIDNDGNVFFTEKESKTDMIILEAGVKLWFFKKRTNRR